MNRWQVESLVDDLDRATVDILKARAMLSRACDEYNYLRNKALWNVLGNDVEKNDDYDTVWEHFCSMFGIDPICDASDIK